MSSKPTRKRKPVSGNSIPANFMYMSWELHKANEIAKQYNESQGLSTSNRKLPLDVVVQAHAGSLAIALHADLIKKEQKFGISSLVWARSDNGEDLFLHLDIKCKEKMSLNDFMDGKKKTVFIDENGEVKDWIGASNLLIEYQDTVSDDYEIVEQWNCLYCTASIKSVVHQIEFNRLKKRYLLNEKTNTAKAITA